MASIDAFIGFPFIFQASFIDPLTGSPLAVTNVNVTLFYYDSLTAVRILLLNNVVMNPVSPPDPSRYTYQLTLLPTLVDGTPLYVEYRGTDVLLNVVVQTDVINAKSFPSDQGLRVRFTP